jgi:hypothetical protein
MPPASGSRSRLVLVVGGLIVAAALGGAFLATRSTGTPTTPVKPTTTIAPTGDDSGIGEAVFEAPSVVAEAQPGAVRFTWNYVQPSPKDTFQVKLGPTATEAIAASPTTLSTRRYDAPVAAGTPVCAVVTVVRNGQMSPASLAVCATAQ